VTIKRASDASKAAAVLGRLGGLSRSPAKIEAARINGKKGGRPKHVSPEAVARAMERRKERERKRLEKQEKLNQRLLKEKERKLAIAREAYLHVTGRGSHER
jgi:hypothetical protein